VFSLISDSRRAIKALLALGVDRTAAALLQAVNRPRAKITQAKWRRRLQLSVAIKSERYNSLGLIVEPSPKHVEDKTDDATRGNVRAKIGD
jgi:hypothetical protein